MGEEAASVYFCPLCIIDLKRHNKIEISAWISSVMGYRFLGWLWKISFSLVCSAS
jgi:hypothetical protein